MREPLVNDVCAVCAPTAGSPNETLSRVGNRHRVHGVHDSEPSTVATAVVDPSDDAAPARACTFLDCDDPRSRWSARFCSTHDLEARRWLARHASDGAVFEAQYLGFADLHPLRRYNANAGPVPRPRQAATKEAD